MCEWSRIERFDIGDEGERRTDGRANKLFVEKEPKPTTLSLVRVLFWSRDYLHLYLCLLREQRGRSDVVVWLYMSGGRWS